MKNIISWENYGLIAELAHRLKLKLSKITLQELIFLLQELFGINCGYKFDFYIYSPYCSDIEIDLSLVERWGGVKVYPVASHYREYNILPGKNNRSIRGLLTDHKKKDALDNLIREFGKLNAKELELMSTIVYITKKGISKQKLLDTMKYLKPGFSKTEIVNAISKIGADFGNAIL